MTVKILTFMTSALLTDACRTGPLETPLVNFIRLPFFQRKTCLSCVKKVKCQGHWTIGKIQILEWSSRWKLMDAYCLVLIAAMVLQLVAWRCFPY